MAWHRRKHKKKRSPAAATVIWFALTFARHILRQKRVHPSSKLHRAMLNPYHGLLHRCLSITRDNQVLQASLRTLGLLMPLQLPGLSTSTPQIANSVFRLLQSSAGGAGQSVGVGGRKRGARSDLGEAAIRTFTLMLRHCHDLKVSDEQLAAVLSLVRLDLDVPARQNATFAVIKVLRHRVPCVLVCVSCGCSANTVWDPRVTQHQQAVLRRKLVCAELYDLMDYIATLLIRSVLPNARQLCQDVFLQFLLFYPLGAKRLQQHLAHFVKNLGYIYESGRMGVSGCLLLDVHGSAQPMPPCPLTSNVWRAQTGVRRAAPHCFEAPCACAGAPSRVLVPAAGSASGAGPSCQMPSRCRDCDQVAAAASWAQEVSGVLGV